MNDFSCALTRQTTPLIHHWEYCLGSANASFALRRDWQEQLARCHRELGTSHVRFHGLLCDDMGVLIGQGERQSQSFVNVDSAYDAILEMGMHPLVELSFMPSALASGAKTVFLYAGNVTPPAEPDAWDKLVRSLIGHWLERYGHDVLSQWPVEVWNEPNLSSFWTATQADYFAFYAHTARALKEVAPHLRVGGPATAKTAWLEEFQAYIAAHQVPCDFISTHYYPTDVLESNELDAGRKLAFSSRQAMREQAAKARAQVYGLPVYLTEWNLSSGERDDLHDQPLSAAYIVKSALEMAGAVDGSSWWTFSDIFTEQAFPNRPFHGGFGLLTLQGVAKPSYRAFQLLHALGDRTLPVTGSHESVDCWCVLGERRIDLVFTNLVLPGQEGTARSVTACLTRCAEPRRAWLRRIDEDHANPRRAWQGMGRPDQLTARQLSQLHSASVVHEEGIAWRWEGDVLELEVAIPVNGVAVASLEFAVEPIIPQSAAASRSP